MLHGLFTLQIFFANCGKETRKIHKVLGALLNSILQFSRDIIWLDVDTFKNKWRVHLLCQITLYSNLPLKLPPFFFYLSGMDRILQQTGFFALLQQLSTTSQQISGLQMPSHTLMSDVRPSKTHLQFHVKKTTLWWAVLHFELKNKSKNK